MLGMCSNFCKDEHTLIGGEIGAFIERLSEQSGRDFFVMRYEKLGVFCICEWMSPNHDIFIDTMNLGESLGNFDRSKSQELRMRIFAPLSAEETSTQIAEEESRYLHDRQDENEEETERWEKVSRGE